MKIFDKLRKFYYFRLANPVVRRGEHGGFKWEFRRFWLDISTISGNFKVRFTAGEHPFGYLVAGREDDNIEGFAATLYSVGMLLTTEQEFASDIQKALRSYSDRLDKREVEIEDEEQAIAEVQAIQEHAEKPKRSRKEVKK